MDFFEPVRGTLTFAPGERSKTIDVGILGDAIDEEDESFVLRLANPLRRAVDDGRWS